MNREQCLGCCCLIKHSYLDDESGEYIDECVAFEIEEYLLITDCPCINCLIKSMCEKQCDILEQYRDTNPHLKSEKEKQ
jgi:hypothetical protein